MDQQPVRIARATLDWLDKESARWRDAGLVDVETRARILSGYDAETAANRGMIALVLFAVTLCAVGLLLLIGYNWDRIPVTMKVSLLVAAVAVAFLGSAAAYSRNRRGIGETLAFAGTLLFGNAIWLIAQVLHISGHFPDAFLWLTAGCLACAWLLGSKLMAVEAALAAAARILAEGTVGAHPFLPFAALFGIGVWVAYRIGSPLAVRILAISAALWVCQSTIEAATAPMVAGACMFAGCVLYHVGRWHRADATFGPAWKNSGLFVILAACIPLMFTFVHQDMRPHGITPAAQAIVVIVAVAAALGVMRRRFAAADLGVALATAVTAVWTFTAGTPPSATGMRLAVVAFSLVALVMAVTLIRGAFRSGTTSDLSFGLLFGLAFLIVRWTSVLENLLWSGLLMLVAGGGLLLIARIWRHRDPVLQPLSEAI